jgi:tetratricopeptide (TPR) repeat protein
MGATMAERFAYLPSLPFLVLMVLAAEAAFAGVRSPRTRRALAAVALLAIAAPLAAATVSRNRAWRDDLALFGAETVRTPNAPLLWTNLAGAHLRASDRAAAEKALREAERLAPNEPWVIARRAQSLAIAGRYEEAIPLQERVVARERPSNAMAHNNLATLYRLTGREERALELLLPIVERLPDYPDPWLNLAEIERARGEAEAAIAAYRRVLELRPREMRAVEPLAALLAGAGHAEEAESVYLEALSGDARDAKIWNNVASLRLARGAPTDALAAVERALELDPAAPRARFNQARLLELLGRADEALPIYRELAALPDDGGVSGAAASAMRNLEGHATERPEDRR